MPPVVNLGDVGGDYGTRSAWNLRGQGVFSQTVDRIAAAGGTLLTDGTVYFMAMPLLAGDLVSNLSVVITAAAVGISLSKLGLYSVAGVRLALSADQGTVWNAAGTFTAAMAAPYVVSASGVYYAAIVAKTATTMPTPLRGIPGASAALSMGVGTGAMPTGIMAGQTDLPSSATIVGGSAIGIWIGAS